MRRLNTKILHTVRVNSLQACICFQDFEEEVISFIDQSFKKLRSATAAFDMLLKFKHVRSREALNKQMMKKFNDILAQYCKEVGQ